MINKIKSAVIVEVDWMDNGSLVLYIESPPILESVIDPDRESQDDVKYDPSTDPMPSNQSNTEMVLKQYIVRYRYVSKSDHDGVNGDGDDSKEQKRDDIESVDPRDRALIARLERLEAECWQTQEWNEVTFDNTNSQFLSTIPLEIQPYIPPIGTIKDSLPGGVHEDYQFFCCGQFMEIEIEIRCQYQLLPHGLTFWTPFSAKYKVDQSNIVVHHESGSNVNAEAVEEQKESNYPDRTHHSDQVEEVMRMMDRRQDDASRRQRQREQERNSLSVDE